MKINVWSCWAVTELHKHCGCGPTLTDCEGSASKGSSHHFSGLPIHQRGAPWRTGWPQTQHGKPPLWPAVCHLISVSSWLGRSLCHWSSGIALRCFFYPSELPFLKKVSLRELSAREWRKYSALGLHSLAVLWDALSSALPRKPVRPESSPRQHSHRAATGPWSLTGSTRQGIVGYLPVTYTPNPSV